MPMPGDVDIVLASELMEAARAVQRGLVTPDRTTLIASTHRVWSIGEKTALGDGRVDGAALAAIAKAAAARWVAFDMAAIADESGSVISAVLFGALAGSGALPFARPAFEETIARGGVGVAASRRAFDAGFASALGPDATLASVRAASVSDGSELAAPSASTASLQPAAPAPAAASAPRDPAVAALVERVRAGFPVEAQEIVVEGLRRTIDWQDVGHARLYLDRLDRLRAAAPDAPPRLLTETARHLALWMTYEDTIRVAALKTRATRFERVHGEVRADAGQVLAIDEYLHPRVQEICETLPAGLGRWLERPGWPRRPGRALDDEGPDRDDELALRLPALCSTRSPACAAFAAAASASRSRASASRRGSPRSRASPRTTRRWPSRWRSASAWSRATATRTSAAGATSAC